MGHSRLRLQLEWLTVALVLAISTRGSLANTPPPPLGVIHAELRDASGHLVTTSSGPPSSPAKSPSGGVKSPPSNPHRTAGPPVVSPPGPRPPIGPPSDGCTGLLASVPVSCPNFQDLITSLGSNLTPTEQAITAAALKNKPTEACCSAWRGFYLSYDGTHGCACSNSIISQGTRYGVKQADFVTVYKAVLKACAYLGGTYSSGFYNERCPAIPGYN